MSRVSTRAAANATLDQPEDKWLSLISSSSTARPEPASYSVWMLGDATEGTLQEPIGRCGLTYKYLDILSEDKEEVAARLHLWNLCQSGLEWKETLSARECDTVVILLDWRSPSTFAQQLHQWMQFSRQVIHPKLGRERSLERRLRGGSDVDDVLLPLGPGEFDLPIPVRVVILVQNAGYMDVLQREGGWNEELFDYVQQYLRTVALKVGASVFYTHADTDVQRLLCQTLGMDKSSEPQIVDRQKVCVPAGWDSWKKITLLREKFHVQGVSEGWTSDPASMVHLYEKTLRGPSLPTFPMDDTVVAMPMQEFLKAQAEVLASLDEPPQQSPRHAQMERLTGPVDVNVGGIRLDAEGLNTKLAQMTREDTPEVEASVEQPMEPADTSQEDVMAAFFQRLLDKKGSR